MRLARGDSIRMDYMSTFYTLGVGEVGFGKWL